MKKIFLLAILSISIYLTGCTEQERAKSFGGDMTLDLPVNYKLEEITWKDDNLWYLTRPMRDDEEAEVHTFKQDSVFGVFEGTITIIEKKGDDLNE